MTLNNLTKIDSGVIFADDDNVYIIPEGKTAYTTYPIMDAHSQLLERVITISCKEYIGVLSGELCFSKDLKQVVPHVLTDAEKRDKAKIAELIRLRSEIDTMKKYLLSKDYIGIKIATAETDQERGEILAEYKPTLSECKNYRRLINEKEQQIIALGERV